jgi:hypothetical protein
MNSCNFAIEKRCVTLASCILSRILSHQHNQWQRRLKRGAAGTRFQQLNIQFGERVTFRDSTLTVIRNGEVFARSVLLHYNSVA